MGTPSTSRKTKPLKYNLHNRGRTYTGQDRSNVDMRQMINRINSPEVQEMVSTGAMLGYYGHQIRQRYGMMPPETAIADGKTIRLEPAIRTIELRALEDGTVEHREEFLDNESGEFARKQYLGNVGGFSTAVRYRPESGRLIPTLFAGFDYVWQPNYVDNAGDGALYDGLFIPESSEGEIPIFDSLLDPAQLSPTSAILAQSLERQIIQCYDNIHTQTMLANHAEQAYDQLAIVVNDNQKLRDKQNKRLQLQRKRQEELYDGMVCETRSFDSVIEEANKFLAGEKERVKDEFDSLNQSKGGIPKWLRFGF